MVPPRARYLGLTLGGVSGSASREGGRKEHRGLGGPGEQRPGEPVAERIGRVIAAGAPC